MPICVNTSNSVKIIVQTIILTLLLLPPAAAQESAVVRQTDSILAILPQLRDSARLEALNNLVQSHVGLQSHGRFLHMYLEEARRQGNVREEGIALQNLTTYYYPQFDNDSIFIFGEEAIRFNRQHKQYDRMFVAYTSLIRRENAQGRTISAMRRADEALAEARELQHIFGISEILRIISSIYFRFGQFEEAIRYMNESLELFLEYQQEHSNYISFTRYDALAAYSRFVDRPQDMLRYADSIRVEINRINRLSNLNTQTFSFLEMRYRAIAHAELNQSELALEAIRNAEEIYDPAFDPGDNKFYAAQLDNMWGIYYLATGAYDRAIDFLTKVVEYYERTAPGDMNMSLTYKKFAQAYLGKGDNAKAAEIYQRLAEIAEERTANLFISQINELRTIYELDRAQLEAERQRAKIRQQRIVNIALAGACVAALIIAALIAWNRKRIAQKNIALYRQIKEHDRLSEKLNVAVSALADGNKNGNGENKQQQEIVDRLRAFMLCDRHFAHPNIDAAELAAELSTNRTDLYKAVKAVTGKGVSEYIKEMKAEEAKRMLETSEEPIKKIVEICGFNTLSTFNRMFREHFKMSPAEYRKSNRTVRK